MQIELRSIRFLSGLLLAAVVFAPSPSHWEGASISGSPVAESLAAQILSPTFDQGLIQEGVRGSFSVIGKRKDVPAIWPRLLVFSWPFVLVAVAVFIFKAISKPYLNGSAPLRLRAPPQSL